MAPAVKQRCTCEVYQCVKSLDPNPMTQVPKPGRLLPASTVHQHRRDDKIWRAARQTGQMQLDVLVADSSFGMGTDDSVVSSRILHGEAGNLQVAVSQPVSLGESTHTSVSVPSRDASAVSTPVPRLLPQVVPSSGYTHNRALAPLESLGHYRTLFNSAISTLSTTNSGSLVFLPVPSGDREDDAPPGIDAAASRHFVVHQQLVGKLLDLVKAVPSNEDADAQVEKERLTAEIRAGKSTIREHSNFQLSSNQITYIPFSICWPTSRFLCY
ncbi:hypothetical protein BKA82DRAFT_2434353 [Pisolithus tinctorius]|nr:hypothetical protein BKA82DRAFT_2434353 [Pisolithus tinctorius]